MEMHSKNESLFNRFCGILKNKLMPHLHVHMFVVFLALQPIVVVFSAAQ
jgi:hypothetical protein